MRTVILLFLLPFVLLLFAVVVMLTPLPAPFPEVGSNGRNLLSAVATGIFGLLCLFGIVIYLARTLLNAGRELDDFFSEQGLGTPQRLGVARRFVGQLQGRDASATLRPAFVLQPWRFELSFEANSPVLMAIGNRLPLIFGREFSRLTPPSGYPTPCHVRAKDAGRTQQFMSLPEVQSILVRLTQGYPSSDSWELELRSDRFRLRLCAYRLSEEYVAHWMEGLLELAAVCETLLASNPPPL
jgi:hypothetical protein